MGFASPAWLAGLLLVPAIWYLHRSGPILRRQPVPSLEPWRESRPPASEAAGRRRADPAWIRRAACAAALSIALAGPQFTHTVARVTVWVDDSASMRTVEHGTTRLQRGLDAVVAALGRDAAPGASADVEVRTLSQPWVPHAGLDTVARRRLPDPVGVAEPQLPDPVGLDRSRAHWLVTDGADASIDEWLTRAPVTRVFQAGERTGNVGIARLGVRPQPAPAGRLALQVRVVNGGASAETRRLQVTADGVTLPAKELSLAAGAAQTLAFELPSTAHTIRANLAPADALANDDAVTVDASTLAPLPVVVDAGCPSPVAALVRAHPALRVVEAAPAALVVDCGAAAADGPAVPRLRFMTGRREPRPPGELLWSGVARGASSLPAQVPDAVVGRLEPPGATDRVLLESADRPLIVVRAGSPRVVETSLDLSSADFAADESLPLLFATLVDAATGRTLLDRSVAAGGGNDASRVTPLGVLRASSESVPRAAAPDSPLLWPLLALSIALLAWDVAALARRSLRAGVPATRSST